MSVKGTSLAFLNITGSFLGKIFIFIVLLGFSFGPGIPNPTSVPFKIELHEKVTSRVSKNQCQYRWLSEPFEIYLKPAYTASLVSIDIRILHRLKIFKKEKSDFHNRNGFRLRTRPVVDEPTPLV